MYHLYGRNISLHSDLDDRRPDHYRGLGFFPLVWTIGFDRHRVIRGGIFLEPTRRRSKNGFVLRGCLSFRRTGFPAGAFSDDDAEDDGVALAIWRKLALKPRRNRVTSPPRK